jgi:hypothetical protein
VNAPTLYAGCAIKLVNAAGATQAAIAFSDTTNPAAEGTHQTEVFINSSGTLQAKRNGTNLGSASTATLSIGAWHYLELGTLIDPAAGWVKVYLDGVLVINLTGQNTRATSNSYANQLYLGYQSSGDLRDDVYVNDSTGSFNNTFLGDIKVIGGLPSGDGTATAWTQNVAVWAAATAYAVGATILDSNSNLQRCSTAGTSSGSHPTWSTTLNAITSDGAALKWTCLGAQAAYKLVNEAVWDDDSSYLSDATVNDQSRFTFPSITAAGVKGAMVFARARKDDAGARSIRLVAKSGATTGDNGADLVQSSTYQNFSAVFEADPNTGAAWGVGALNAAEFGVNLRA